ncbi:MAG: FeoC-like transcriptional regulator [Endozoicomonas sp. (ex Botrylloides leachii)]|nr:FeoC-like transcriptional regulator [Endozoicomonas sp. (ex Botrylloides leachii)]
MLIDIQKYLSSRGVCSLAELSNQFKMPPDAMRGMLSHWMRKGKVIVESGGCNKGCVSCSPDQLEVYRWQNSGQQIPLCSLS